MRLLVLCCAGLVCWGCSRDAEVAEAAAGGGERPAAARESTSQPPPVPASTRILGAWRYAPPAEQLGPVIDLVFADGALRRTVNGRHEVELTYSIAEEGGDHVVLDVDGSGAIRRSREHWRLRDDDALIHEAAPGVVYVRVAPADVAAPAPGVAPVMGEGSSGP